MITTIHLLVKKELTEKKIEIDPNNHMEIKFLLQKEINTIRDRLLNFKTRGIILTTSKNARILDKKYREEIINLMYSRRSIIKTLITIKNIGRRI